MIISLSISEILASIKRKSHYEVSGIADAEERYRVQAGTEKETEIFELILRVASTLNHRLRRFLRESYQEENDNRQAIPEAFVFDLDVTDRRSDNLGQSLTDAMHNYVVHYTLSKYYADVSQGELSNKHSAEAIEYGNLIDRIIYTKQPPII